MTNRRGLALRAGAAAAALIALLLTALPLRGLPVDDKFITAVYARHLASGQGWVFNEGERVNASTSALNALLGAAAGVAGLPIPGALWALSLLAAALAIGLLIAWPGETPMLGRLWVAGLLAACPVLAASFGLESALFVLGLVATGLAVDRDAWRWAFLGGGLLALVRGEGALVALLLAPLAWGRLRRFPWPELAWMLAPTVPWALFSWIYFGDLVPTTLAAKRLQGNSGLFGAGILELLRRLLLGGPATLGGAVLATLAVAALLRLRRWARSTWLLVAFGLLTVAAYEAWQIPATSYFWYATPLLVALFWVAGEGLQGITRRLPSHLQRGVLALLLLVTAAPLWIGQQRFLRRYGPKADEALLYARAGAWVAQHTAPTATVAVTEVGQNGWHMGRRLIDLAGLITPEIGPWMLRDFDQTRWLLAFEPDWILLRIPNDRMQRELLLAHPGFRGAYQPREVFAHGGAAMELFERTGSVRRAMAAARRGRPAPTAAVCEALGRANALLSFAASPELRRFLVSEDLAVTWQPEEGLVLAATGPEAWLWLPWIDVPAGAVREVQVVIAPEAPTRQRARVLKLYWRGTDASGEVVSPYGLLEVPALVNTGVQRVVFPVGDHPRWRELEHVRRLRIDLGPGGLRARLVRLELLPWR